MLTTQEQKKYNEYKQERTQELDLFSSLGGLYESTKYSTTIELYDLVPKYFYIEQETLRKNNKLDILVREFVHGKQPMEVQITPAQILDSNNKTKFFYPSFREKIIEDVLRKFAIDKQRNALLDSSLSVILLSMSYGKNLKKPNIPILTQK